MAGILKHATPFVGNNCKLTISGPDGELVLESCVVTMFNVSCDRGYGYASSDTGGKMQYIPLTPSVQVSIEAVASGEPEFSGDTPEPATPETPPAIRLPKVLKRKLMLTDDR